MMEPGKEATEAINDALDRGDVDDVWDIVGDGDIVDYL